MQAKNSKEKRSRKAVLEAASAPKKRTSSARSTTGRRVPDNGSEIAARLLGCILDKHETIYAYANPSPFPVKSVYRWVNPANPVVPDAAQLIDLALDLGVSLDWLLLGEGPETRGALERTSDLTDALHSQVVADCATRAQADREEVGSVIPSGAALLNFATNAAASEFARWRATRDAYEQAYTRGALRRAKEKMRPKSEPVAALVGRPVHRKALDWAPPRVTPSMVGWVPLSVPSRRT